MRRLVVLLILFSIFGCVSPRSDAQFLGYVSPQTVVQKLASSVSCTGSAQTFVTANLGQTQHYATISANNARQLQMEIDGVDAGGNSTRISDVLAQAQLAPTPETITGNGYFPIVQIVVTCSGAGSNFTVTYSGTSTANPQPVGGYQVSQIDKALFLGLPANASQSANLQPPFGSTLGTIVALYQGAAGPSGSSINLACAGNLLTTFSTQYPLQPTAAGVLQAFQVPSQPCTALTVTYGSGGASSANITLEYIFFGASAPPFTVNTVPALQGAADGLASAFVVTDTVSNPVTGQILSGLTATNIANRNVYFDRVVLISSVAATINVSIISNDGTCSFGNSVAQLRIGGTAGQATHFVGTCSVAPTVVQTIYPSVILTAGVPTILDLRGFVGPSGTQGGLETQIVTGITGTLTTSWYWYEKGVN